MLWACAENHHIGICADKEPSEEAASIWLHLEASHLLLSMCVCPSNGRRRADCTGRNGHRPIIHKRAKARNLNGLQRGRQIAADPRKRCLVPFLCQSSQSLHFSLFYVIHPSASLIHFLLFSHLLISVSLSCTNHTPSAWVRVTSLPARRS